MIQPSPHPLDRDRLTELLGAPVPQEVAAVRGVTHDSRAVEPGWAFVAVPGFQRDGVEFVPQAVAAGADLVVAERDVPGVPTAVVPDARAALATLACAVWGDPSSRMQVHGITGTNGKTTTSYALHAILCAAHGTDRVGLLTTAEVVIGDERQQSVRTTGEAPHVQATLARMEAHGIRQVVLETSSHGIALKRVAGTHYSSALFTNLTRDHLDLHGTMEAYYEAKRELFHWAVGPKLSNGDDPWGRRLAGEVPGVKTFGCQEDSDFRIADVRATRSGTRFTLRYAGTSLPLHTPLLGDYNVFNTTGAAALALELGVSPDVVAAAVAEMPQVPGRFERVAHSAARARGVEVIVDYAHTDVGLELVLGVARTTAEAHDGSGAGRVICVYGAAGDRDPAKRPLMGEVASRLADVNIITTDDAYTEDPAAIAGQVMAGADPADTIVVLDRRAAIRAALERARPGDVVVVAGKGHERVQHLPDGDVPFHDATVVGELLDELAAEPARR
ncbi:MAG TPA: UDP-N-acetylmuramoyl-L-alanyl-D-glutamate--2,6-diaminopimelate ligase [Segeticoccus sp.]|uniref:UDP-N-acetylmuramoyl-L-alanyl-D-glutamate--2, 6-diaminopimelate ligase n=1 Tax=Segeticoccus sp. TaxID=2706531 RepID=UPI002D8018B7|nr:UDP-N-acetylmuramoyl-L-alanyl-D-glutamate--2,6-diaminopimelate ligase [Segeticoccus sp.]HET8601962.1 UDP-N-acetylmuramoyl-L-alanyl-D-glutamate--2,6-diaminopimelate ligase [Segeticoccus sp.]